MASCQQLKNESVVKEIIDGIINKTLTLSQSHAQADQNNKRTHVITLMVEDNDIDVKNNDQFEANLNESFEEALQKQRNKSTENKTKRDERKDDDFPVLPLIIPNNCTFDSNTMKLTVNHDQQRDKLVPYEPVKGYKYCFSAKS